MENHFIKHIRENIETLYSVIDRNPKENEGEEVLGKIPDLEEMGTIIETTDGQRIHLIILNFSKGLMYGSLSNDGIHSHTFDITVKPQNIFNKVKRELEKNYDCNIKDVADARKRVNLYLQKLKIQ